MSVKQTPNTEEKTATVDQILSLRREKREKLIQGGKKPYGRRFQKDKNIGQIRDEYESKIPAPDQLENFKEEIQVTTTGRLMTRRDLGKLCFSHIHDHSGKLQLKVSKEVLGPEIYKEFIKIVDIGDILGVSGYLTRTKKGELSIQLQKFEILSKSLRPWPEKYHGLTDIEARSRQRELDLNLNEESRRRFIIRSTIINSIRDTLSKKSFIEVETPLMQPIPGGAAAKPFTTHHEALDLKLYMRIAPELFLKRLLVGGFERVYEIGRAFRNEGIDTRHNPEFTILEAYQAFGDVNDMMDLTETLIHEAAKKAGISESVYRGEKCDLQSSFDRASLVDLFKKHLDLELVELCQNNKWAEAAKSKGLKVPDKATDRKCFDLLFDEKVLIHLSKPTFVLDYPTAFSPLAKQKSDQPLLTDRFELFMAKEEVANAYTEQNDPEIQNSKFKDELSKRQSGDEEAMPVDDDFILALEHGMPPAGGLGIGIDRLTMIFTGSDSIREVILFPLLRPQT